MKLGTLVWILGALAASAQTATGPSFDRRQSAALFVGVQQFTQDPGMPEVRYAVDDAIDLAYVLALDPGVGLVTPRAVILALSGKALKAESRQRLNQLLEAGATVAPATRDDVLTLLRRQADRAGRDGMLIIAIASHGFSRKGVPYVLTSTSLGQEPQTALATATVLEIAAQSRAERALVLLDACRDQNAPRSRAGTPLPIAATPLLEGMAHSDGHVILLAAPPGKYAYDDAARKNGVFTTAVIDALQCKADSDAHGLVTAEALSHYVDDQVRSWVNTYHDPSSSQAIQIQMDGNAGEIPLAICSKPK